MEKPHESTQNEIFLILSLLGLVQSDLYLPGRVIFRYNLRMLTTKLRRVGGSIMMVVPPAILDMLQLQADATVVLAVEGERLIVESPQRARYTLAELLAQCDSDAPHSQEDREWQDSAPVGRELL
jgi:antitoxin ChpS